MHHLKICTSYTKSMDIKPGYILNHSPSSQSFMLASLFKFPGGKDCTVGKHDEKLHSTLPVSTMPVRYSIRQQMPWDKVNRTHLAFA